MRILFIDPPIKKALTDKYTPNCGYLYMAAYLKAKGYGNIKVLDAQALGMDWGDVGKFLKDFNPDIVATSSVTADIYRRMHLMRMVKELFPSVITVMGGYHASMLPEDVLRISGDIDYVVIGEGEITFLELVKAKENKLDREGIKRVKGLGYLEDGAFIHTGSRPLINDLSELPLPDYSLVPLDEYRAFEFPGNPKESISVNFSRGCFHKCIFCPQPPMWQNTTRSRKVSDMIEEIAVLHKKYSKNNFIFSDNDFFYDRQRNIAFLRELRASKIKIKYSIMSRAENVIRNKDLLPESVSCGLVMVKVGVESFSQVLLDEFKKSQAVSEINLAFGYLIKSRIPVINALIIWGNYGEARGYFLKICRDVRRLGASHLTHSFLTPFPGTELYNGLKKRDIIKNQDFRCYNFFQPVLATRSLSCRSLFFLQVVLHFIWCYSPAGIAGNLFNKYRRHLQLYYYPRISFNLLKLFARRIFSLFEKDFYESYCFRTKEYYSLKPGNQNIRAE